MLKALRVVAVAMIATLIAGVSKGQVILQPPPSLILEDKVAVRNLSLTQPVVRDVESEIFMAVYNHSSSTLTINWRLSAGDTHIASGSLTLPAGTFYLVRERWTVKPGVYDIVAQADPANTLEGNRANNRMTYAVNLPYPDLVVDSIGPTEIRPRLYFASSSWRYDAGTLVVHLTSSIRNHGTAPALNVNWSFRESFLASSRELGTGTIARIDPGASVEVRHPHSVPEIEVGRLKKYGMNVSLAVGHVEPLDRLSDNYKSMSFIAHASPIDERNITLTGARNLGAQFTLTTDDSGKSCTTSIFEQPVALGTCAHVGAPQFKLDCTRSILGGRATGEAFRDFPPLRNGWIVAEVRGLSCSLSVDATATWEVKPALGGTSLHWRARMSANRGSEITTVLVIRIEGPAGTDPFR